ncbi:MAG TPA: zf-HC2 domain-containing protein [Gemmatimonadota bacterium]|nr:zf-HC2 domain-containing protein [Gemmatimonadota bacterium]
MTCEEVRGRLDDWVEGKLGGREAESVAAHVAGCDACRAEARALEELLGAAAGLPREIRPPQDLWDGIDARLADEPEPGAFPLTSRRLPRAGLPAWALIAAALALVLVTAAVTSILTRSHDAPIGEEARFLAASQELLAGLEAQDLSPETMEIVRRNLEVIDAAIAELQLALERDPGNGELTRMLLATYQRKIELLEQAARSGEG